MLFDIKERNPGYLDLSRAIIAAVERGSLPVNSPLPPSRVLAESLGVSRDTILNCYRHLKALGWIESRGTAGTFVARRAPESSAGTDVPVVDRERLSDYAESLLTEIPVNESQGTNELMLGAVPKHLLPIRRWKSCTEYERGAISARYESAVLGRTELRSAAAAYLSRSKGIACVEKEIAVFNISFTTLTLISRLFLQPGDLVAIENPGYGGMRDVARFLALDVVPVPLDAEGISVTAMERSKRPIKLVYVTPNHHEPTGVTMSLERRRQLLAWAQKHKALIIEDDYDGLFHYGRQLPPSLKSMDTQDNVVHLASFWQVLYPLTTLSLAVIPAPYIDLVQQAKVHTASLTEDLAQVALANMLDDGYLQKYCRRIEKELAASRRALIYELKRAFGTRIRLAAHTGGLTVLGQFDGYSDEQLIRAAGTANLPITTTERFYLDDSRSAGEVQIHFAWIAESAVRKTIERFISALD